MDPASRGQTITNALVLLWNSATKEQAALSGLDPETRNWRQDMRFGMMNLFHVVLVAAIQGETDPDVTEAIAFVVVFLLPVLETLRDEEEGLYVESTILKKYFSQGLRTLTQAKSHPPSKDVDVRLVIRQVLPACTRRLQLQERQIRELGATRLTLKALEQKRRKKVQQQPKKETGTTNVTHLRACLRRERSLKSAAVVKLQEAQAAHREEIKELQSQIAQLQSKNQKLYDQFPTFRTECQRRLVSLAENLLCNECNTIGAYTHACLPPTSTHKD